MLGSGENKREKLQVLFEEWCASTEKWSSSKLVLSIRQNVSFRKRGARRWFTRMDLEAKYGGDTAVADEIIQEKVSLDPQITGMCVRKHPDAPSNEKLRQYLCFDEGTEADEEDKVLSSMYECVEKQKEKKSKKDKKRKRSTSDSDTSSKSSKSSSSPSSSSKKKKSKKKGEKKKSKKGSKKEKGTRNKKVSKEKKEQQEEKQRKREENKKEQEKRAEAKKAC